MYEKLRNFLFLVILIAIAAKYAIDSGIFVSDTHKGKGYSIKKPVGWEQDKQYKEYFKDTEFELVSFITPEKIQRGLELTNEPQARITIFSKQLESAFWIEDEFPNILSGLVRSGMKLIDKGEIKINDQLTNWVFYENKRNKTLNIEFYAISDRSIFYQIQYTADVRAFEKYRKVFEETKDTFKISERFL